MLLDYMKNNKNGFSKHNANITKPITQKSKNLLDFYESLSDFLYQIVKDTGFKQLTIPNSLLEKPNQLDFLDENRKLEYKNHQNTPNLFNDFSEFCFKFNEEEIKSYNFAYKKYSKRLVKFNSQDRNLPLNPNFDRYNFAINTYTPKFKDKSFYESKYTLLKDLESLRTDLKNKPILRNKLSDLEIIKSNIKPEINQIDYAFNQHEHSIFSLYSKQGIKMIDTVYNDDNTKYAKRTQSDQLNNFIRRISYLFNTIMLLIYPFYRVANSKNGYYLSKKTDKVRSDIYHQITELSILNIIKEGATAQTKFSGLVPLNNMTKNDYTALNQETTKPAGVIGFIKNGKFLDNDRGEFMRNILLKYNWKEIEYKTKKRLNHNENRTTHTKEYEDLVKSEINKELIKNLKRKQIIELDDVKLHIHIKTNNQDVKVISAGIHHKKKGKLNYIPIVDKYSKTIKEHRKLIFEFKQNALESTIKNIKKANAGNSRFKIDRQSLRKQFDLRMIKKLKSPKLKGLSHLEKSVLETECYLEFNTTLLHLHHKSKESLTVQNEINSIDGVHNKLFFMITHRKIVNLRYHRKDELTKAEINSHSLKTTILNDENFTLEKFEFIIQKFRNILNDTDSTLFHLTQDFINFFNKSTENKEIAKKTIGNYELIKEFSQRLAVYKKQSKNKPRLANENRKKVRKLTTEIESNHYQEIRNEKIRKKELDKNKPVKLLPLPILPTETDYFSNNKRLLKYKEFNRNFAENVFFKSHRKFQFNKSELDKKEKLELQYKADLIHYKNNINLYENPYKNWII